MSEPTAARPPARFARELTALVAGPVMIWIIGWGSQITFNTAITLVCLLALHEFLVLGRKKGYDIPMVICLGVALLILLAFVLDDVSVELGVFVTLLVIPGSYVFSKRPLEDSLPSSAISVLATMYVGMLGGSIIRLRADFGDDGPRLVFFLLLVVWMGDAGAYYTGRMFGRRKLSPRISPKKTIEGGIGGMVTSIIAAIVIHLTFFPTFPIFHAAIAGLILSIAGMIGDLAESMWKRSADVKDSGSLIPGHGGFLDRLDSILYTAPILYFYWTLIVHDFRTLDIMSG